MDKRRDGGGFTDANAKSSEEADEHVAMGSKTLGDSKPQVSSDEVHERNGNVSSSDGDTMVELPGSRMRVDDLCATSGGKGDSRKGGEDTSAGLCPNKYVRDSEGDREHNDVLHPELKGTLVDETMERECKTACSASDEVIDNKEEPEAEVLNSVAHGLDDSTMTVAKGIVETNKSKIQALEVEKVDAKEVENKNENELMRETIGNSKDLDIGCSKSLSPEKLDGVPDAEDDPHPQLLDAPSSAPIKCPDVVPEDTKESNDSLEATRGESGFSTDSFDSSKKEASTVEVAHNKRKGYVVDKDKKEQAGACIEKTSPAADTDIMQLGQVSATETATEIDVGAPDCHTLEEREEEMRSEGCKETCTNHIVNDKKIGFGDQDGEQADGSAKVEITAADGNTVMDPNFDIANCIDFSGVLSCSVNDSHAKSDMMVTEVVDGRETHNSELQGSSRNDQDPNFDSCTDEIGNVAPETLQSDSNRSCDMDEDKQVSEIEHVELHPEGNTKVKEPSDENQETAEPESVALDSSELKEASHPDNELVSGAYAKLTDHASEHSEQIVTHDIAAADQKMGQDLRTKDDSSIAVYNELPKENEFGGDGITNKSWGCYASYQLPLENEDNFSVSDLIWGKIRSHPWWPGQIFDCSDASEEAMKHYKENSFLVAYFGDGTFAWNDISQLKPFLKNFSELGRQSSTESFKNAVNCAVKEIARRVELGLACSCLPSDVYDNIRFQTIGNGGIRKELSRIDGLGMSVPATSLKPNMLVYYIKALAVSPSNEFSRLDLEITKVHLLAFYRLKGYYNMPEFQSYGKSLENDANCVLSESMGGHASIEKVNGKTPFGHESTETENHVRASNKRKHNLKDGPYGSKRQKSLSELMGETVETPDSEVGLDVKVDQKGRMTDNDDFSNEGRKAVTVAKVSSSPQPPKASFKIGDCIRRAASQLTGSPLILKSNNAGDGSDLNSDEAQMKSLSVPPEIPSTVDLLYQLHLAAQSTLERQSALDVVSSFFLAFRNSKVPHLIPPEKSGVKRSRSPNSMPGPSEAFEFDEMNDTYWTDRMIDNGEEQQSSSKRGYQLVPVELKPVQRTRRPYTKRKFSDMNRDIFSEKASNNVDENAPVELIMNFSEMDSFPSEVKLNRMFRHFGPIKESLTEVDRDSSRARVVFKKCSDAEVAANSAGKFNIFGPLAVNYELSYTVAEHFKVAPYYVSLGVDDVSLCDPPRS